MRADQTVGQRRFFANAAGQFVDEQLHLGGQMVGILNENHSK